MLINKRIVIIAHDLLVAALAWQFAWLARFNFEFPYQDWQLSLYTMPLVVLVQGAVSANFKLYRGIWRFASLPDLWNIVRAAMVGVLCIALVFFIAFRLEGIPRSILILYPVLLTVGLGGPRLAYRFWKDRRIGIAAVEDRIRILIVGAGRAGDMLVREILRDSNYLPIGFVDDRRDLRHAEIQGVRVLGSVDALADICKAHYPDIIAIAIPSATGAQMRRIIEKCEATGISLRTMPGLDEIVVKSGVLKELRDVSIEDLLGRDKVSLDWSTIAAGIAGKNILVTGAGGSIGLELCRQIARLSPNRLVMIERSEFNLFRAQQELSGLTADISTTTLLGDICDNAVINTIMQQHHPDVVFHAAAHKHVPILQENVREAVTNNIFGTACLADAANEHGCEKFVMISTDKAVNPVNVLGMSKRIAELYCEMKSVAATTRFITVRFGNVLGSDGSVIPLFQEQIKQGGPVTVTHPEMERYFMTIREACELILQAGAMGTGGEVFVLDMGRPVRIAYLAERMIRLAGAEPGVDVPVKITGLRPGEKLQEELFYDFEERVQTAHSKIILAKHARIDAEAFANMLRQLRSACDRFDDGRILDYMTELCAPDLLIRNDSKKIINLQESRNR